MRAAILIGVAAPSAGCLVELELKTAPTTVDGATWTAFSPPASPGSCGPGLPQGERIDSAGAIADGRHPDHAWQFVAARTALSGGGDGLDLVSTFSCGVQCPEAPWVAALPSGEPFLDGNPSVSTALAGPTVDVRLAACDLDEDGTDEIAVSAALGAVDVFWGGDLGGAWTRLEAPGGEPRFGTSLWCGSVGEGPPELLVGSDAALYAYAAVPEVSGLVGAVSVPLPAVPIAVADPGDADGDGVVDLAYVDERGTLLRWDGQDTVYLDALDDPTSFDPTQRPRLVGGGDLDGDGLADLLVAQLVDGIPTVELRPGAAEGAWETPVWTLTLAGSAETPRVAALPARGDGPGDLAIATSTSDRAGQLAVFSVDAEGVDDPRFVCDGLPGEQLGGGLGNPGDLDGDRLDELIVTRRRLDRPTLLEIYTPAAER